jgi:hypothetical protein
LFAKRDPTLEAYEWTPLRAELQSRGLLKQKGLFIVTAHWIDAGRIDHALHGEFQVQIFGEGKQYAFRYDPNIFVGRDALIIGDRHRLDDIDTVLRDYFFSIEELPPFAFGRSGMEEVHLRILHAHELKRPLPSSYSSRAGLQR